MDTQGDTEGGAQLNDLQKDTKILTQDVRSGGAIASRSHNVTLDDRRATPGVMRELLQILDNPASLDEILQSPDATITPTRKNALVKLCRRFNVFEDRDTWTPMLHPQQQSMFMAFTYRFQPFHSLEPQRTFSDLQQSLELWTSVAWIGDQSTQKRKIALSAVVTLSMNDHIRQTTSARGTSTKENPRRRL
ncbi:hypothetical protein LTR15_005584 [Elasticomyces elasticus]|nr:hypothetical protein LTR15_005584 [Elasticomyces elasticus]